MKAQQLSFRLLALFHNLLALLMTFLLSFAAEPEVLSAEREQEALYAPHPTPDVS